MGDRTHSSSAIDDLHLHIGMCSLHTDKLLVATSNHSLGLLEECNNMIVHRSTDDHSSITLCSGRTLVSTFSASLGY